MLFLGSAILSAGINSWFRASEDVDFPFKFMIEDMEDINGWKVMDPDVASLELFNDAFEGEHPLHVRVDVSNKAEDRIDVIIF